MSKKTKIFDNCIAYFYYRYNKVRVPNNDNNCKINPKDEEYQLQIKEAKDF